MKAVETIKVMNSVSEALLSDDEFIQAYTELQSTKPTGVTNSYSFKLGGIVARPKAFNHLAESDNTHAYNPLMATAKINSDKDDDAYLKDAGATIEGRFIRVTGYGDYSGQGGHADLLFNPDGSLEKIKTDSLKGMAIEEDDAELEDISMEVYPELYRLFKSTFGPTAR